jgi:hypothetical protein
MGTAADAAPRSLAELGRRSAQKNSKTASGDHNKRL